MNKRIWLSFVIFAFILSFAPMTQAGVAPPTVDITGFDMGTYGWYDVNVSNGDVYAFAVGNNTANKADTDRYHWEASVVSSGMWDGYVAALGLPNTFEFLNIFGASYTQAAVYYDLSLDPIDPKSPFPLGDGPLGQATPWDGFFWDTDDPTAPFIAYYDLGNDAFDFVTGTATIVVPEPISSTLFLAGGAILGFRYFRKRKRA